MLKAIEIENFKAFGDRTRIEMAPITLIYGQNSAGKSTILQALNLLKQTHESRDTGAPLLPRAENGIVDLGSFREMLFDHDTSRVLRLGVEIGGDIDRFLWRRFMGNAAPAPLGVSLGFGRASKSQDVTLQELAIGLGSLGERFASFVTRALSEPERREVYRTPWSIARRRPTGRRQRMLGAECNWVSASAAVWEPVYRAWSSRRSDVHELLTGARKDPARWWRIARDQTVDDVSSDRESDWSQAVTQAIQFYAEPFTRSAFVERMTNGWRGMLLGLDGFLPVSGRRSARAAVAELELFDSRFAHRQALSLPNNDVAGLSLVAGRLLEDLLDSLFPMGPYRRPPERWYIFTGSSPEDVGYKGDHLPDLLFRRADLVKHANEWLARLDIGYHLKVMPIGDADSDLFEVRLHDARRQGEVDVGLADVGFGISQILPFLVQCLASNRQLISIEQPEVHIHPRLQADLGELLAESIREPFSHQFLIETHSEHLVLRLQKLIRAQRLQPGDVSVVFVERAQGGSRVKRLQLDERGEFVDEWPGGFFPERLRELA